MVFDLDLGTIRSTAQKHVAPPGYVATVATVATTATNPAQSVATVATVATVASSHGAKVPPKQLESVASVATVAAVASSQRLETAANEPAQTRPPPAPPAYDPGHAALLALAMAYCDRTGVSDKARRDWQRDIADTPPELRADLYQHLRAQLPPAPPRPAPAAAPRPPAPMSWSDLHQPWRAADDAYLAHWGKCPACKAAATGHTDRCTTGKHLHHTYLAALPTT